MTVKANGDAPGPAPRDLIAAAAAAKEEVLSKTTLEALINARPETLIAPNIDGEQRRGNANRSGGWLHSPAHLELFAVADQRLTRIATEGEVTRKKVERVHCRLIPGTKLVIIKPAAANDLTALPVTRYAKSSSAWINLISLLEGPGLAVETGYRERYDAAYIPEASPLAPGLVIDLSRTLERRTEPAKKSSKSSAQKESTKAGAKKAEPAPQAAPTQPAQPAPSAPSEPAK